MRVSPQQELGRSQLPEGVYVELVSMLFSGRTPVVIIGIASIAFGTFVSWRSGDAVTLVLAILVAVAAALRIATFVCHGRRVLRAEMGGAEAAIWERRLAVGSFAFAALMGILCARSLAVTAASEHMLAVGLLFGYGAGVVTRLSVRPWIAIGSLATASLPFVAAAFAKQEPAYMAVALLLTLFLVGSFDTVMQLARMLTHHVTSKQDFARLARSDALTGLPNRLLFGETLDETLDEIVRLGGLAAIHCLDLDGFKAVNDRFGHPAGDALLNAAAARISGLLRTGDIAARLGGDEFVVLQRDVAHADAAGMLARRIVRAFEAPFQILGHSIYVGTSVGVALAPDHGSNAATLLAQADAALYLAKGRGRSRFCFAEPEPGPGGPVELLSARSPGLDPAARRG